MAERRDLTNFPWNALPHELQVILLRSFDLPSLGKACRVSKAICAQAIPIFWSLIDLKTIDPTRENCRRRYCRGRWQLEEKLQAFFLTCHLVQQTRPTRWRELAAHIKCLRLVKVPAMQFREWLERAGDYDSKRLGQLTHNEWPFPTPQDPDYYAQEPTIWDVICDFKSLEELEIYVQQNWEHDIRTEDLAQKMQGALPQLKKLKIGGDVSREMMLALLSTAHATLEELSCIALLDGTVGQHYYSHGLLHLAQTSSEKSFPKLRSLQLSKLAELAEYGPEQDRESMNDEMGVPWPLEENDDLDSLQDWATFIGRVSNNLRSLTLEDCYLVGRDFKDRTRLIDPGYAYFEPPSHFVRDKSEQGYPDPMYWGAGSRSRFRKSLLPVLVEQAWPQLKRLVLVGLALPAEGARATEAEKSDPNASFIALQTFLDHLSSRDVDVELRPAGVMKFNYDATPLAVTPSGSWHAG